MQEIFNSALFVFFFICFAICNQCMVGKFTSYKLSQILFEFNKLQVQWVGGSAVVEISGGESVLCTVSKSNLMRGTEVC